jgi:hypothetical protein
MSARVHPAFATKISLLSLLAIGAIGAPACRSGEDGSVAAGDASVDSGAADSTSDAPAALDSDAATPSESGPDAPADTTVALVPGLVFDDDFAPGIAVADFGGATNAYAVDKSTFHGGTASLKITLPASGYTGAACVASATEDLSGFDALTFWAKADVAGALDTVGYGNSIGSQTNGAEIGKIALTTTWTKYVIPVPRPSVVTAESGLFYFATAAGAAYKTVWLDDVKFESLGASVIGTPSPALKAESQSLSIGGGKGQVGGTSVSYTIGGQPVVVHPGAGENPGWPYFTYASDAPAVASVDAKGAITPLTVGTAHVTATMGSVPVVGSVAVDVSTAVYPTSPATTPTVAAIDVYSLFSSAYTNKPVDGWLATWSTGKLVDPYNIGTHPVKEYQSLGFVGIEFFAHGDQIDATPWTAFHLDVWTPAAKSLRVKLVDFGANAVYGGGDDSEAEVAFTPTSTPALTPQTWVSLEIPFSAFLAVNPAWKRAHLSQLVLSTADATAQTVFVDNVYFHR